jgi:hypothetical protein
LPCVLFSTDLGSVCLSRFTATPSLNESFVRDCYAESLRAVQWLRQAEYYFIVSHESAAGVRDIGSISGSRFVLHLHFYNCTRDAVFLFCQLSGHFGSGIPDWDSIDISNH